jgi:hypothetical protein
LQNPLKISRVTKYPETVLSRHFPLFNFFIGTTNDGHVRHAMMGTQDLFSLCGMTQILRIYADFLRDLQDVWIALLRSSQLLAMTNMCDMMMSCPRIARIA